ncbi:hypothetical protein BGX27_006349, partial [Mortierella sp. AM989]
MCREIAEDFNLDADTIWNKVVSLSNDPDELHRLWFGDHCAWSGPNVYASAEESAAMYARMARDCLSYATYPKMAGNIIGGAMCAQPQALLQACIDAIKCEDVVRSAHDP